MVELALAVGFLGSVLAIGIGAAASVSDSAPLWFFEACCLFAVGLVLILEVRPRVVGLRARRAALRRFRRQLDAFPEAPHPLDRAVRRRSKRSEQ
jgi:hypothetical protein